MFAAVAFTSDWNSALGLANVGVNGLNLVAAVVYMAMYGHYFKHSDKRGKNWVTALVESNNYWNILSVLWASNYFAVPLIKMSYGASHGLPLTATTALMTLIDTSGMAVCALYTASVWL